MKKYMILLCFVLVFNFYSFSDEYAGKKASLWKDNSFFKNMYVDPKARGINDIVIIKISETSSATNKAGLKTTKKTSTSMGIDAFLGLETDLKGKGFDSFDPKSMFGGTTNNSNQGEGESKRDQIIHLYNSKGY